jgi:hypothetical protein
VPSSGRGPLGEPVHCQDGQRQNGKRGRLTAQHQQGATDVDHPREVAEGGHGTEPDGGPRSHQGVLGHPPTPLTTAMYIRPSSSANAIGS